MFSRQIHRNIFLFGVFSLAFGMMMGTTPTSVPQIILAANWLFGGRFGEKWARLRANPVFWVLISVYIVHVIGVFYSHDTAAALHDLRTKMPLAVLPLFFFSEVPLSGRELRITLYCFIAGSVANTAWCHVYSFVLHDQEVVRDVSRFMSHIRLGLYLDMAIAACLYLGYTSASRFKFGWYALSLYFLLSMLVLGLASGLTLFVLVFCGSVLVFALRRGKCVRIGAIVGVAVLVSGVVLYLEDVHKNQFQVREAPQNLPQRYTPAGIPYAHFDSTGQRENGYYVLINIDLEALRDAWNTEFPDDTFSYTPPVNIHRYEVLLRYMSSRGLMKDSAGYSQLTKEDKAFIRQGFTNYLQPEWSFLRKRAYELANDYHEFRSGRAVNGHSFTMRLYFWKAAWHAIGRQPWLGCGTGDVQAEMDVSYDATGSPLDEVWRIRPHNQFITVTLATGVVGLSVFLIGLIWPAQRLRRALHVLYWPFLALALLSFLFEDTLETQAGLTFYAFFNTLFLSVAWFRTQQTPGDPRGSR